MKKILLLGGSGYLLPVIEAAHKLGLYVITCDYLPDNVAHPHADEYINLSIVEKDKVLEAAQARQIDGILSFACDPGVVTAAYVAEKMGLPFQCSYEAACILQDKGLFREFLTKHGFNVPHAKRYTDKEVPAEDLDFFTWPVIVKPVDSAGSKGVTKVTRREELPAAIEEAVEHSLNGAFIIEDFLTFEGYHSSTDPFTVDGKLQFITYSDQLFDPAAENPYTPARIIWPSSMTEEHQTYLTGEIQRLMDLLHTRTGIYNIETCVGANGKPYIMEVSPRGGGCRIAELQKMAYGVDLIENEVRKAVGMPLTEIRPQPCRGHWCELVVHAQPGMEGILQGIRVDPEVEKNYLRQVSLTKKEGDHVQPFTGANMSLGDMFLQFESREQLDEITGHTERWLHIDLKK